jgi:hypothetical protein
MQPKIDKNIPSPPERTAMLRRMEPGDSVYVPGVKDATAAYARYFNPAKRIGIKIKIRKEADGVRIWRTE